MEFGIIIDFCISIMNIPFIVLGFTITLWQLFIFIMVTTLFLKLVFGLLR